MGVPRIEVIVKMQKKCGGLGVRGEGPVRGGGMMWECEPRNNVILKMQNQRVEGDPVGGFEPRIVVKMQNK